MAQELKEFINGDDKYVASVAQEIDVVYDDYIAGRIDKDMLQELVNDSIELAKVRSEAQALDTKVKLEKLFEIAKVIASLV